MWYKISLILCYSILFHLGFYYFGHYDVLFDFKNISASLLEGTIAAFLSTLGNRFVSAFVKKAAEKAAKKVVGGNKDSHLEENN